MRKKERPDEHRHPHVHRPDRAAKPEAADVTSPQEEYTGYHEIEPDEATPEEAEARRKDALQPRQARVKHGREREEGQDPERKKGDES